MERHAHQAALQSIQFSDVSLTEGI
jgi:hypothetical protein